MSGKKIMKWRPKNFSEALLPLTTAIAIIGYGAFEFPAGKRHKIISFIYTVIITSLYYTAVFFTIKTIVEAPWYKNASQIFLTLFYANTAIASLGQIISWHKAQSFSNVMKEVSKVDETLQKLGATINYTNNFDFGIATIGFWTLCVCILDGLEFVWLAQKLSIGVVLLINIVGHHAMHINSLIVCNFSATVSFIGMRFRRVNELLENVAKPRVKSSNEHEWRFLRFETRGEEISKGDANRKNSIQIIKHVHLKLSMISEELNQVFSVQVALQIAVDFLMLTGLLYDILYYANGPSFNKQLPRVIVHSVWFFVYLAKILLMNWICESVSVEARRTGNIIHCIDETFRDDPALSDEIKQFSLQIVQHPLFFCPAGLFTLGYKFVCGFLGTVITYLVIVLDMNGVNNHRS